MFLTMEAHERFNWGFARAITFKERIKLILKTLIENKPRIKEWSSEFLDQIEE